MFTVALIGPDGAGKTSIARRLPNLLSMPVAYVYMGVNPDSSNHMLPTTRLIHAVKRARGAPPDTRGPRDPLAPEPRPRGPLRRVTKSLRSLFRLVNRLAEEWHRQLVARRHVRRGAVVLFDRHFFADYYTYDVAHVRRRTATRRLHGFLLSRLYPRPDLVVYLDAPAEVLFARKREGTLESLARRRRDYLELRDVMANFVVVDADRPFREVAGEVADVIEAFSARRRASAEPKRLPAVR